MVRPLFPQKISTISECWHNTKSEQQHIEASQHFGIYIVRDYTEILDKEDLVEDLISIATGDAHKVVVMVAEHITLPEQLKPYVVRSKHQMKETG